MTSGLQLVREVLEEVLSPHRGTRILFKALERCAEVPTEPAEVLELVNGPLAECLGEQLGAEKRDEVTSAIVARLDASNEEAALEDIAVDVELYPDFLEPDDRGTVLVESVTHPVSVLVLSGTSSLAGLLGAALGAERVSAQTAKDLDELRHGVFSVEPLFVVADAVSDSGIASGDLARAFGALPDRIVGVVWGAESAYGDQLRHAFDAQGVEAVFLGRQDGVEPLLDLVLSRFAGTVDDA